VWKQPVWNQAERTGQPEVAHYLKSARWALWHNPKNLTDCQQATLAATAKS
jgi:hypothetical protein